MILNPAESHLPEGQAGIHARIGRLDGLIWYAGIGWVVFGAALSGVWPGAAAGVL
jgi:hypothetical protein